MRVLHVLRNGWVALLVAVALLAGCEGGLTKQNIGMVAGGAGGGVIGSQFGKGSGKTAATILGAVLGAGAGGYIGKQMDENDRVKMSRALEYNQDGQATPWRNPNSGRSYSMVPTRTYQVSEGNYCREFTQKVNIGGEEQNAYGTACRQPDGTWKITNMN